MRKSPLGYWSLQEAIPVLHIRKVWIEPNGDIIQFQSSHTATLYSTLFTVKTDPSVQDSELTFMWDFLFTTGTLEFSLPTSRSTRVRAVNIRPRQKFECEIRCVVTHNNIEYVTLPVSVEFYHSINP